jgi:hypothetical protein
MYPECMAKIAEEVDKLPFSTGVTADGLASCEYCKPTFLVPEETLNFATLTCAGDLISERICE